MEDEIARKHESYFTWEAKPDVGREANEEWQPRQDAIKQANMSAEPGWCRRTGTRGVSVEALQKGKGEERIVFTE